MPKRKDIKKILIVGAGPIIIGQACEFDYSGTQACKALKDEGYKVILINSNPATIMTDPGVADKTYIEPITIEVLEKILIKEKPDAILPTMGGQTALNLAINAEKAGLLKKYKIELIGANSKAISNAEDRKKFRKNMVDIGLNLPKSEIINNVKQAKGCLKKIGLPAIIRPAFTLGGLGGGIAKNKKEFFKIVKEGLDASPDYQRAVEIWTAQSDPTIVREFWADKKWQWVKFWTATEVASADCISHGFQKDHRKFTRSVRTILESPIESKFIEFADPWVDVKDTDALEEFHNKHWEAFKTAWIREMMATAPTDGDIFGDIWNLDAPSDPTDDIKDDEPEDQDEKPVRPKYELSLGGTPAWVNEVNGEIKLSKKHLILFSPVFPSLR